jgi:hypothetical protein
MRRPFLRAISWAVVASALACSRDEGPCGGCYGGAPHPVRSGESLTNYHTANLDLVRLDGSHVTMDLRDDAPVDRERITVVDGRVAVDLAFPIVRDAGVVDGDGGDAGEADASDGGVDASDSGDEAHPAPSYAIRSVARITWTPPEGDEPRGPVPMLFRVLLCPERTQWYETLESDVCRRESGTFDPPELLTVEGTYEVLPTDHSTEYASSGLVWAARIATPRVHAIVTKNWTYRPESVDQNCY